MTSSNFVLTILKNKTATGTKNTGQKLKQLSSLFRHDSLLSISEEGKGVNVFQSALSKWFHIIIFRLYWRTPALPKMLGFAVVISVVLTGCKKFVVFWLIIKISNCFRRICTLYIFLMTVGESVFQNHSRGTIVCSGLNVEWCLQIIWLGSRTPGDVLSLCRKMQK